MQKTRLGISVGLLGAATFFTYFFGGYTISIILAGYILLFEDNAWLKKAAVKGVALVFAFAIISAVIQLIPNTMNFISSIFNIFGEDLYVPFITSCINTINNALVIAEKILFILLGLKAFNQGTIKIPVIDSLVDKYMD